MDIVNAKGAYVLNLGTRCLFLTVYKGRKTQVPARHAAGRSRGDAGPISYWLLASSERSRGGAFSSACGNDCAIGVGETRTRLGPLLRSE